MPSITKAVHTAIDQDIYLQVALVRGYVNKAAVARWLQRYREIDASVDGILDATDKYDLPEDEQPAESWKQLKEFWISKVQPVTMLVLERDARSSRRLGALFDDEALPYQKAWWLVPSKGNFLLIVDEKHKDDVIQVLGAELITVQPEPLQRFGFEQPTTLETVHEQAGQPGALTSMDVGPLALAVLALQKAGIPVRHVATGHREHFLTVRREDESQACSVLTELYNDSDD